MQVSPELYEFLILSVLTGSGVAVALLAGFRNPFQVSFFGFGFGLVLRLVSALGLWQINQTTLLLKVWAISSLAIITVAFVIRWRMWKTFLVAMLVQVTMICFALAIKYWLGVGEMEHTDSADIVANSLLVIQSGAENLTPLAENPKRGLLYPLLLALGPGGRILSGITPLIMLNILGLASWLTWRLTMDYRRRYRLLVISTMFLFLLSIPIGRLAFTYLNSHTLTSFGLLIMATSALLVLKHNNLSLRLSVAIAAGGIIAATSRIEAILLTGVLVVLIASRPTWRSLERWRFFFALLLIAGSLIGWLEVLDSPLASNLGLTHLLLVAVAVFSAAALSWNGIDRIRSALPAILASVVSIYLAWVVLTSGQPLALLSAQWPNFGLGAGGWGTAALAFLAAAFLLGWRHQHFAYKWLIGATLLSIAMILASKTLDGNFGREGFFDSVNRMVLHVLPLAYVAISVGTIRLFQPKQLSHPEELSRPSL